MNKRFMLSAAGISAAAISGFSTADITVEVNDAYLLGGEYITVDLGEVSGTLTGISYTYSWTNDAGDSSWSSDMLMAVSASGAVVSAGGYNMNWGDGTGTYWGAITGAYSTGTFTGYASGSAVAMSGSGIFAWMNGWTGSGGTTSSIQATLHGINEGNPTDPCDLPLGSCPADVDQNGLVAVGDVLAVIGGYGDCGDGTYRPVGDVDGDCCVSVTDILAVIGAWGEECDAVPTGACCLDDGTCLDGTDADCASAGGTYQGDDSTCKEASCPEPGYGSCCFDDGKCLDSTVDQCGAFGGSYQGDGTSCDTSGCPKPGAGDECSAPLTAYAGPNAFETLTATPSDNEPTDELCPDTFLDWDGSPDIWFAYTPDSSGMMTLTTCDAASYDTSMVLYEGECDNQVACNGDTAGDDGCQSYYSKIEFDATAGETYYIRIGGWQAATGEGTLTIE